MKKMIALLLLLSMLLSVCATVYACEKNSAVHLAPVEFTANDAGGARRGNCSHPNLVRITANSTRYVKISGALHSKEEYFTARCSECMKCEKEIINSQEIEPHSLQLVISECNTNLKKHRYVYKCNGKCNYEEEVTVNCPGMHEEILDPQLIVVPTETE